MVDLATLGLAVDSKPVKAANDDLKDFQKSAQGAEKAADSYSRGTDKASKATDRLRRSVDDAEKSIGGLKIGLVAVGAAIGTAFGIGIGSAIARLEAINVAMRKIDVALANNGYSYDVTGAKIKKFADDLERSTGRAAQEVLDIAPNLASFGFTEDVFFRAIKLADDMSAAWGGDLKQNLEGLSRALADPVKGMAMLSQRGITLTYEQKKLAKQLLDTGQGLKAQGVVFGALEEQISGVAASGFTGLTKALASSKLAIEGFFEAIVTKTGIMTALEYALLAVAFAFDTMANHMDGILMVVGSIGAGLLVAFGPAILSSVAALAGIIGGPLLLGIQAVGAALLANPLGLLVAGIGLAVTAIYNFRDEIQKAIGVDVWGIVKSAANMIINSFIAAFEDIKFVWAQFPNIIGAAVVGAVNAVVTGVGKMVNIVIDNINDFIKAVSGISSSVGLDLKPVDRVDFKGIDNPYTEALAKAVADRNKTIADIMNTDRLGQIGAAFTPSSTPAPTGTGTLTDREFGSDPSNKKSARKKLSDYEKEIRNIKEATAATEQETKVIGMSTYAKERQSAVQKLLTAAQRDGSAIGKEFANAQELINASSTSLSPALAKQRDEILNVASAYAKAQADAEKAQESFDFAKDLTKGFLSDLKGGLENGEGFWKSFGNAAISALDKITDKLLNDVIDALFQVNSSAGGGGGGFLGIIGNLFGGGGGGFAGGGNLNYFPPAPSMGLYAEGGISNKPAIFGESGPEAAVPLPDGRHIPVKMLGTSTNQVQDSRTVIEVRMSPDVEGRILEKSGNQSVELIQQNNTAQKNYKQNGGE
jgi:hypothetical protein